MKIMLKKLKRRNKFEVLVFFLIGILYLLGLILFIKNLITLEGIETLIRIIVIIFFVVYFVIYIFWNLLNIISKKHKMFIISIIITVLFIGVFALSSIGIDFIYTKISGLSEYDKVTYTSYMINLKEVNFDNNSVIGRIEDQDDKEGYVLANKIIEEHKLTNKVNNYDDYLAMLTDLYEKKIDAIFVPANYISLFNTESEFININTETKIIYQKSEKMTNDDASIVSSKDFKDPLTILVMGVDSTIDGLNANAAFNGDTLMLVTFNPHTLSATMFSIPRDTYVPIACKKNAKAKINSSAAYGTKCVIDTVENFTGINIDYYVKINFKGVVDLVNALGGITVDVQKPDVNTYKGQVCEQNSDRQFGTSLICMNPGVQNLNGEQALAYSRCRHLYLLSDLVRIKHQQEVVTAMGQKVANIRNFKDFEKIINAVTKNISTNMTTSQMLSAYQVIKSMMQNALDKEEIININKTYLEVYNLNVFVPSSKRYTSALGYYTNSLKEITKAMKVNLELEKPEPIKSFSFSVNEEFIVKAIGEGIRTGSTDGTLPSFANSTVGYTQAWCTKNKIKCTFEEVDEKSEYYKSLYDDGVVASQSVHDGSLISTLTSITFYVNKKSNNSTIKNEEENMDNTIKNETEEKNDNPQKSDETLPKVLNP